jgi:hypothetical protein
MDTKIQDATKQNPTQDPKNQDPRKQEPIKHPTNEDPKHQDPLKHDPIHDQTKNDPTKQPDPTRNVQAESEKHDKSKPATGGSNINLGNREPGPPVVRGSPKRVPYFSSIQSHTISHNVFGNLRLQSST